MVQVRDDARRPAAAAPARPAEGMPTDAPAAAPVTRSQRPEEPPESRMSGLPVTSGNKEALPGAMLSEAGHAIRQPAHAAGPVTGPVRTCVGCRHRDDRSVLLRVVAAEVDGVWSVVPDPRHRRIGRGASLHPTPACLDLAERRRAFPRALRRSGPLDTAPVREYVAAAGCADGGS